MGGRPRIDTTNTKLLKGTYRADRDPDPEIENGLVTNTIRWTCPVTITDEQTKNYYALIVESIQNRISNEDKGDIDLAFLALQDVLTYRKKLEEYEKLPNPELKEISKYMSIINSRSQYFSSRLSQYGISPIARSKLALGITQVKKETSLMDKILNDQKTKTKK